MRTNRIAPFDYITNIFPTKCNESQSLLRASSMQSRKGSTFSFLQKDAIVDPETTADKFVTVDLSDADPNVKRFGKGIGTYIRYIEPEKTTYKTNCDECECLLHIDNVVQYDCKHNVCGRCTRLNRRDKRTIMCAVCKKDIDWIAIQSVNTISTIYSKTPDLAEDSQCA